MKNIFYYTFLICNMTLFSCSKSFLDEVPRNALTDANAISNLKTAKAAIGGVYSSFQNDQWGGGLFVVLAGKSGFFTATQTSGDYDYNMNYTQTLNSATAGVSWTQFYKSLNYANFAIRGITTLTPGAFASEGEREKLIAEGRCLRAWISANILWNFGHWWADDADIYGLLFKDEPADISNVQTARLSVGDSYKKIYEDLDYAIAKLGDFTTPRYMSRQFAKALKAKVLLYRAGYRNTAPDLAAALVLVNDVLANHPAAFGMESNLADVYANSWDSKENLFSRYLEDNGSRAALSNSYASGLITQGDALPLATGGSLTAGLLYGADWFKADPRWSIVTGAVRHPLTSNNTSRYAFKKLARLGVYGGQSATPKDEKYAAYYFRYPELYLMKAELLARTGAPIAEAIAPVNEMRSKRISPVMPALNPASREELMDVIFKEIFMELSLENGSEFFASLRFKTAGQPWIVKIKAGKQLEENKICWPIPDAEMLNNLALVQNPDLK